MLKYAVIGGQLRHILPNPTTYPIPQMNALYSYHYTDKHKTRMIYEHKNIKNILIDSGAFTFQQKGINGLQKYIRAYKKHIKETCEDPRVNGYFEMDIDNIIGYDEVKSIREELFEVTDKIIPVWHKSLGIKEYKRLCHDYEYIAFSGVNKEDVHEENMLQFVNTAHKYGAQVHGLGVGAEKVLKTVPFDSVDASTWSKDVRYGKYRSRNTGRKIGKEVASKHHIKIAYMGLLEELRLQKYYKNYWG